MNTMTPAEFAAIRRGIGYTRAEIAKLVGVAVQTVQHWEKGKHMGGGYDNACDTLARLFAEWQADVDGLLDRLDESDEDAPVLAYPRLPVEGRPDGWWRALAFQVLLAEPDTMLEFG